MRHYQSANFFPDRDFPLSVSLARQREFMVDHWHDFTEIVLVSSGRSLHQITDRAGRQNSYGLIRGDVFAVMPGDIHSYRDNKNFEIYNIAFLPSVIAAELPELSALPGCRALLRRPSAMPHRHIYLDPPHRELAVNHLQRMIYLTGRRGPVWKLQTKTAFLNFLFEIGMNETLVSRPDKMLDRTLFLDSLDYLEKNIRKKITLEKLARIAGMSISSYTAQFRRAVGLSPIEYLINLRIIQARNLLVHSKMNLAEIAAACGFCDANYMTKLFRAREKTSLGRLRRTQLADSAE